METTRAVTWLLGKQDFQWEFKTFSGENVHVTLALVEDAELSVKHILRFSKALSQSFVNCSFKASVRMLND